MRVRTSSELAGIDPLPDALAFPRYPKPLQVHPYLLGLSGPDYAIRGDGKYKATRLHRGGEDLDEAVSHPMTRHPRSSDRGPIEASCSSSHALP